MSEFLLLIPCVPVAGSADFVEITVWGNKDLPFRRRFLAHGMRSPSDDTLYDAIAVIHTSVF